LMKRILIPNVKFISSSTLNALETI